MPVQFPAAQLVIRLPVNDLGKAMKNGSSTWVPAGHNVGILNEIPTRSSSLSLSPLSLYLSFCLSNKQIHLFLSSFFFFKEAGEADFAGDIASLEHTKQTLYLHSSIRP